MGVTLNRIYQYSIVYRPGKDHFNTDALGRLSLSLHSQSKDDSDEEQVLWVNFLASGPVTARLEQGETNN